MGSAWRWTFGRQMKTSILRGLAVLAPAVLLAAPDGKPDTIIPYRFCPLYYPGEEIVLKVPGGVKAWRAVDMDGGIVATGKVTCSTSWVQERDFSKKYGAFRYEALDEDGKVVNSIWLARLTSREASPCPWVGVGTHNHHGWYYGDNRFVDVLAAGGIGVVRDGPHWDACERQKGVYTPYRGLDAYVDALNAKGIKLIMLVCYGNPIYDNPVDADAYANFCSYLAKRYLGRVEWYEIWNEPQNFSFAPYYKKPYDSGVCWVTNFVTLCHKADAAIRAVDPKANVALSGEDVEFYLDMMFTNGMAQAHSVVSFHPYCHTQHRPEREYFLKDFGAKHRALAQKHGGADRWVVTEAGWPTFDGEGQFWEVAGCYPKASYAGQAECIVRMYLAAKEAGCEFACQYDFIDDGGERSGAEDSFGMLHRDLTPKPSFAAVAYLTRLLGTATFQKDLSTEPDQYRVAGFVKNGKPILAVWSIEGECEWEVPAPFGPLDECRDLCGNPQPAPIIDGRRILLTERPIYLIGK
jgi:hypothetical protein